MAMFTPITDIASEQLKLLTGNPFKKAIEDELEKTKSIAVRKYIVRSTNFLYVLLLALFVFGLWYFHLSHYDFTNPYFNWEWFVGETIPNIIIASLFAGIPYLLLMGINAIIISIARKMSRS